MGSGHFKLHMITGEQELFATNGLMPRYPLQAECTQLRHTKSLM